MVMMTALVTVQTNMKHGHHYRITSDGLMEKEVGVERMVEVVVEVEVKEEELAKIVEVIVEITKMQTPLRSVHLLQP